MEHPKCAQCGTTMTYICDVKTSGGQGRHYSCCNCGKTYTQYQKDTGPRPDRFHRASDPPYGPDT